MTQPRGSGNSSDILLCPRCGTLLPSRALFCRLCGQRITIEQNEDASEQKGEETVRLSALGRAQLRIFHAIRLHEDANLAEWAAQGSAPAREGVTPATKEMLVPATPALQEEVLAPSTPIPDIETQELATVVHNKEGGTRDEIGVDDALWLEFIDTVRLPLLPVHMNGLSANGSLSTHATTVQASSSALPASGGTLIGRWWQLARSLVQRFLGDSLLRNSVYIMGTGVATAVVGYVFWILATRLYTPYEVGLGSALISAMSLASVIANLGMGPTLVQVLPRREKGKAWSLTLNAGLVTGFLAGLLTGAAGVVLLPLISPQFSLVENHVVYALAFIAGVPLMTVSTLLDQAFIAERAAHNMFVRNTAVSLLKVPLLVLPVVLLLRVGALGVFASGVLAMAALVIGGLLLLVPRLGRGYRLAVRGMVGQVRSMLSSLTGNYFISLGGLATQYLLPIVVAIRLSATDNAYYFTTSRVSDFVLLGSAAVATSLFAEGSHAADSLSHKVRASARIVAMVLGPGILVCLLGGWYILSVFGPSYAQHGLLLLRIDALSSIPDAITNVYISVLRVQRRLRFAAGLNLSMVAITLVLSWVLLPVLGIAGQGLAYLISQGVGSLVAGVDAIRLRHHRRGIS